MKNNQTEPYKMEKLKFWDKLYNLERREYIINDVIWPSGGEGSREQRQTTMIWRPESLFSSNKKEASIFDFISRTHLVWIILKALPHIRLETMKLQPIFNHAPRSNGEYTLKEEVHHRPKHLAAKGTVPTIRPSGPSKVDSRPDPVLHDQAKLLHFGGA